MISLKQNIISQLQKDILPLQGYKPVTGKAVQVGLGAIERAFPNNSFPAGAMHEFISTANEHAAATRGFVAGLLSSLVHSNGACVWISCAQTVFPPAMQAFGVAPHNIIFITLKNEKEVLWAMEEALKCEALAAVAGELQQIDFKASRRLQLAVEQSRVTGFILRHSPRSMGTIACVARWQVTAAASDAGTGMPGVGFARWKVDLLKIRNGKPGSWQVEWSAGRFAIIEPPPIQTIWLNASSQYGSAI